MAYTPSEKRPTPAKAIKSCDRAEKGLTLWTSGDHIELMSSDSLS